MKPVAGLFAVLWMAITLPVTAATFVVEEHADRLVITAAQQPVAEFVFRDAKILRPYLANVHAPNGLRVTRNHPPQAGDANDHDTMHPGIWLALGDLNGHDFWRNKAKIQHLRFTQRPQIVDDTVAWTTESALITSDDQRLGRLLTQITLQPAAGNWLIVWTSTFHADDVDLVFGDQEEMGFGARLATPLTEKQGGRITNSHGQHSAAKTWGQPAAWCDYSGKTTDMAGGILLVAAPENFRDCWWHNRDYGVFVANPFGRAAMKQGERSAVTVRQGDTFRLRFAALIHDGDKIEADQATAALKALK